jgi:dienelactone hydrolase
VTVPDGEVRAVAVLLHGGAVKGDGEAGLLNLAALRVHPIQHLLARAGAPHGLATVFARYAARGWNGGAREADGVLTLRAIAERWPGRPIAMVGHSMGARVALRAAGEEGVAAVAALAPWTPPGEPVAQLAGRSVMLVHATADRTTSPLDSLAYAEQAVAVAPRTCRFEVADAEHKMLKRASLWHDLAIAFTLSSLGLAPPDPRIAAALTLPPALRVRVAL